MMDDIWNANAWNEVKCAFPNDKNGSRVMFTTRSHEVADKCRIKCNPHQLRFLTELECWELLRKKVFRNGISPPNISDIGKLIAKNCKGLPLAVVVIAGLLASKEKNLSFWTKVSESLPSYLADDGQCTKILELSYKQLPNCLKPCLLYLGAFPKDTLIKVKQVILLWIAEGFVQESKIKSIEVVAKEYFHDLVDRSLVIINERSSTGEIRNFRVHDLIHDICQTKCREANFFQLNHGIASSSPSHPSINNQYRVSTVKQTDGTPIVAGPSHENVRSQLFFRGRFSDDFAKFSLMEFRHAQVLDIDFGRGHDIEELGSLVLLRHIHAFVNTPELLPSSISNLWNIGSLILEGKSSLDIHTLPKEFWKMKSLRHVKVYNCKLTFSDGYEDHEVYPKLDKVVSFSGPILSTRKDIHRLLQRLPAVRELSCILNYKQELRFEYDEFRVSTVDIDRMLRELRVEKLDIYRKLDSLKLTVTGGLLYLIKFPSTLQRLTLKCFKLPWTAISTIAELHCLRVLKLQRISFPEQTWEMEDVTFPNLVFFDFSSEFDKLRQWKVSAESFPCLEQLVIRCSQLEKLPSCFGEISALKRIKAKIPNFNSVLRIQEEQMELGNKVDVVPY